MVGEILTVEEDDASRAVHATHADVDRHAVRESAKIFRTS